MSLLSLGRLYAAGVAVDSERLRAFQNRHLLRVLDHAARSVPYYRDLLRDAGVADGKVRGVEELATIPMSSKDDLRRWPESERTAAGNRRLVRQMTNGSSGKPFTVLRTPEEELTLGALRELAKARLGARPWHRSALLLEPSFGGRRLLPGRVGARVGLFRLHHLDPRRPWEELACELIRLSPDVVTGYTSVVAHVASLVGERTPSWRPRCLFAGGETLTLAARRRIAAGFSVPVFNLYAAAEFNLLAYDCPRGAEAMHVCDEGLILEVIRDGRPAGVGEAGSVVGTGLHSQVMPLIRYDTGDRAVRGPQPCPCGWAGTTLLAVEGRVIETFRLPGGRSLHPVSIVGAIAETEQGWVDEHRLIQEEEDLVTVLLVPLRQPAESQLQEIRARAETVLGPDVRLRVELVDRLPDEPGPKRRPFISRVR